MAVDSTMDADARRGPNPLALAYLAFFGVLALGAVAVTFLGDPHAGESIIGIDVPQPASRAISAQAPTQKPAAPISDQGQTLPPAPQAVTQQIFAGRALIADPALIENTAQGPLPKIADNGAMPMRAYAPPVTGEGHPRIAIVIGGLGISARQTDAALKGLPQGVTLGFLPYAADAQRAVSDARAQGHEVLLEVPMEPFDYPDSDPGPHTLRAGGR
ncbi:MAG: divergent polysaccharide deacetylase family protein [Rhizomicrobium sp.]